MSKFFFSVEKLKNMNPKASEILKEYLFANYDLDLDLLIDVLEDLDGEDLNDVNLFLAD